MAGELWGLLLRLVVRDSFRTGLREDCPGAVEAGDAGRLVAAVS
jgi:hypothetical protein